MGKKISIAIVLAVFLYAALVLIFKPARIFEELLIAEAPTDYVLVYGKHNIGQVMVPRFPGFCKLGFFVFNNSISAESDLVLHIKNALDAKKDNIKLSVNSRDVRGKKYPFMSPQVRANNGGVYFFEFDAFEYKTGEPLYFYLESPGTSEAGAYRIGIVRNIFRRGYAGGDTYIDASPSDKHLLFQNYYKFNQSKMAVLKEIRYRLFQDKPFIVFYLGLCAFLIMMIIILAIMEKFTKK